ncbi:cell division protein FtsX [Hellea balneolensis]|uniref:cell division protein FtsX n=1 Tax=Hellea balneolensis TaxID=287478 RepID=UPI00068774BC|nr:FtsX-like permease family protein [Hellea balneolensis]
MDNSENTVSQPLLNTAADNARSLIIVLAIMSFLAALALLFSLSADRLRNNWQGELQRTATVQLLVSSPDLRDAETETALKTLRTVLPSADIAPLGDVKSRELLTPWLGNIDLPEDLPLPVLISVKLEADDMLSPPLIITALGEEGLIAEIDDHSRWSDQIGQSARGLKAAALAILALIFGASIAVSAFATQAALSTQRDVIQVLVQVGAEDGFIAKLFIKQAGLRGLKGSVIGAALGLVAATALSLRTAKDTALLPDLNVNWTDSFYLILMVAGLTLICSAAAGFTTFRLLRRERRRS